MGFLYLLVDVLLSIPLCTILTGVIVSILVRPIFVIRYAIPAMPFLVLFLVYAIWKCKDKIVEAYVVVISLVIGIICYGMLFRSEYRQDINPLTEKTLEAYSTLDCYMVNICGNFANENATVMLYYLKDKPVYVNDVYAVPYFSLYDNLRNVSSFNVEENDEVVYFCNVEMTPFDQIYTLYNDVEYIGEFSVSDMYPNVAMYLLTK